MLKFYTNIHGLNDGFGESLKFIIYSILFTEYMGGEFHYYPFEKTLEHNYDNDKLFLLKKEEMMRFYHIFPVAKVKVFEYEKLCKFTLIHFFEVVGKNYIHESKLFRKCKEYFYHGRERSIKQKYIAIHIRRMNTLDLSRVTDRIIEGCDVPDSIYVDLCILLKNKHPNTEIHIYSQGKLENFSTLLREISKIVWHLNEPVESNFYDMVFADVLVVAPSAFSYCAGLYSNSKEIYYIQSYFTPLPDWFPITGYISTRDINRFKFKSEQGWVDVVFDPIQNQLIDTTNNRIMDFTRNK